jgi:hypothetical protein
MFRLPCQSNHQANHDKNTLNKNHIFGVIQPAVHKYCQLKTKLDCIAFQYHPTWQCLSPIAMLHVSAPFIDHHKRPKHVALLKAINFVLFKRLLESDDTINKCLLDSLCCMLRSKMANRKKKQQNTGNKTFNKILEKYRKTPCTLKNPWGSQYWRFLKTKHHFTYCKKSERFLMFYICSHCTCGFKFLNYMKAWRWAETCSMSSVINVVRDTKVLSDW